MQSNYKSHQYKDLMSLEQLDTWQSYKKKLRLENIPKDNKVQINNHLILTFCVY